MKFDVWYSTLNLVYQIKSMKPASIIVEGLDVVQFFLMQASYWQKALKSFEKARIVLSRVIINRHSGMRA